MARRGRKLGQTKELYELLTADVINLYNDGLYPNDIVAKLDHEVSYQQVARIIRYNMDKINPKGRDYYSRNRLMQLQAETEIEYIRRRHLERCEDQPCKHQDDWS